MNVLKKMTVQGWTVHIRRVPKIWTAKAINFPHKILEAIRLLANSDWFDALGFEPIVVPSTPPVDSEGQAVKPNVEVMSPKLRRALGHDTAAIHWDFARAALEAATGIASRRRSASAR